MDAGVYELDTVLRERYQWAVPVYQRHYEWETKKDKQIPKLWDDLRDMAIEKLDKRPLLPHYFGAIICYEPSKQRLGVVKQRLLVDGQQRITSFQLMLAAIREAAREYELQKQQDVIDSYLYNEESRSMVEPDRERFKLWPSNFDRDLYKSIVEEPQDKLKSLQRQLFYKKSGNLIWGKAPKLFARSGICYGK